MGGGGGRGEWLKKVQMLIHVDRQLIFIVKPTTKVISGHSGVSRIARRLQAKMETMKPNPVTRIFYCEQSVRGYLNNVRGYLKGSAA